MSFSSGLDKKQGLMIKQATNTLQAHALDVLLEVSQLIGDSLATEETINAILHLLSNHLHLHRGRVILPDAETGKLKIQFAEQLSQSELERGSYAVGEGITGQVMATGQIALIPDVSNEPMYVGKITNLNKIHDQRLAYIAVPILQNNLPIGVLAVEAGKPIQSDFQQELHVLRIIAAMIGQLAKISGLVHAHTQQLLKQDAGKDSQNSKQGVVYGILGESEELRSSIKMALKAAGSDASVLLEGESGSGKERFARMIHLAGPRRDYPFVCINCAAIPANLLEAELFGYEKGSFTGATSSRAGKLELAHKGTLFLDEIGDMSLDLQAKLLRVLQDKIVQRIGGQKEFQVDARIISATNQALKEAVGQGSFRMDLYYRINVIRIKLPPLRSRKSDIRLLASYFMIRENQRHGRNVVLQSDAQKVLDNYSWPGNVRQLENVIVRLVIMTENQNVTAKEIEAILAEDAQIKIPGTAVSTALHDTDNGRPYGRVNTDERHSILQALRDTRGNKTAAARKLGLTTRQLYYRMKKLEIPLSNN